MYTILLAAHIASMVLSLGLMSGAIAWGLRGKNSAARIATLGMIATAVGAVSGSILLIFAPLLSECLILTAYLSVVTSLYIFGFGGGFAEDARLIRRSAPIQKS